MVKSHTRKKSNKSAKVDSVVAHEIKQATDYIKQWTTRELSKLQREDYNPVCIPVDNGYRIGLYQLHVYNNKTCDVFDPNNKFIHRFEGKISAILYTIYTIKRKYWLAENLLVLDTEINKNYTDMLNLRRAIEIARQRQDFAVADIRQSRLDVAEHSLKLARDRVQQIHRTAKINKVWE